MERSKAEQHERLLKEKLGTRGERFSVTITSGRRDYPLRLPRCTLDPLHTAAFYVPYRRAGGDFMLAIGVRDLTLVGQYDSWLKEFAVIDEMRMVGQPPTYLWSGVRRVELRDGILVATMQQRDDTVLIAFLPLPQWTKSSR